MRKLPLGVMLSAAVHAAVVAWLGTRAFAPRLTAEAATTTPIEVVVIDRPPSEPVVPPTFPPVAPIDVARSDDRPAPPAATAVRPPTTPPPSRAPSETAAPDAAIIVPNAGVPNAGSAQEASPPRSPTPSTWMAMRRGDVPRPVLPSGRWDDLDHVPRGTTPEKDLATGILQKSGGGTYQSNQDVFVGKVAPDGSVKITDSRNLRVHLALPSPKALGRSLAGWYESDKGPSGAEGDTAMAKQIQVSPGSTADPKDPVTDRNKDRATTAVIPVFAGRFDTTDWLMRRHGQDPYAHKKLAFLDATRDERVQIGNRHRAAQLALTPQIVQRNLEALWAATSDVPARKQALFELWDECAEPGDASAASDPRVVAGGEAARRLVIGFIRAHLPAGDPDAFTPGELAELARTKHSKAAFQPYE